MLPQVQLAGTLNHVNPLPDSQHLLTVLDASQTQLPKRRHASSSGIVV